jgi:hypothetical protein
MIKINLLACVSDHAERNRRRCRRYRRANLEALRAYDRVRGQSAERRQRTREWLRRSGYERKLYAEDAQHRLRKVVRARISYLLKKRCKSGVAVDTIGCTGDELAAYLEARFEPGMSWDNRGLHGWHVDHVRPLLVFDLTDPAQMREASHYTNLQPLWKRENERKHWESDVRQV